MDNSVKRGKCRNAIQARMTFEVTRLRTNRHYRKNQFLAFHCACAKPVAWWPSRANRAPTPLPTGLCPWVSRWLRELFTPDLHFSNRRLFHSGGRNVGYESGRGKKTYSLDGLYFGLVESTSFCADIPFEHRYSCSKRRKKFGLGRLVYNNGRPFLHWLSCKVISQSLPALVRVF